jgi:hypothetical protein
MYFHYEAMDAVGREFQGKIEADSPEEAQQEIRNKGHFVTYLTNTPRHLTVRNRFVRPRRFPASVIVFILGIITGLAISALLIHLLS